MADDVFHFYAEGGIHDRLLAIRNGRLLANHVQDGTGWVADWPTPAPARFVNVTVVPMDSGYTFVCAIADDGDLYAIGDPGGEWVKNWPVQPPTRLVTLAGQSGPNPLLFGLDIHNDVYAISIPSGQWTRDWANPAPCKLVMIAAQGGTTPRLFAMGMDGDFYAVFAGGNGVWEKNWPARPPVPCASWPFETAINRTCSGSIPTTSSGLSGYPEVSGPGTGLPLLRSRSSTSRRRLSPMRACTGSGKPGRSMPWDCPTASG